MNLFINLIVKKDHFISVGIDNFLKRIPLNCKDGAAQNKNVWISSGSALHVTVNYSFEGNWMLKLPSTITFQKV
jgi:hypothetical protein